MAGTATNDIVAGSGYDTILAPNWSDIVENAGPKTTVHYVANLFPENMIPDPNPNYGSYGIVSSGEALVLPDFSGTVAVYATWDPNATAWGYNGWTSDACYSLWSNCEGQWHNVVSSQDVDQTQSPSGPTGANGIPWLFLGTVTNPGNLEVNLSDNAVGSGLAAQFGEVLVLPLQPTLSIAAVGQGGNSQVAAANGNAYTAWQESLQPIQIPVEGEGNRTEIDLHAATNQFYSNVPDWSAVLPSISGLEFWTSATGGTTPLTPDANGNLVDQAFSGNGTFDMTLWVSSVGSGSLQPISFSAEDSDGDQETVFEATAAQVSGWTAVGKWNWSFAADHIAGAQADVVYPDCFAKANGSGSTLQQLAIAITGHASDASLVQGQLKGKPINDTTKIDVAPLLAKFEENLRKNVAIAGRDPKFTTFGKGLGTHESEKQINQLFTASNPFPNGLDCEGMARVVLLRGLIVTLNDNQAGQIGPNGQPTAHLNEFAPVVRTIKEWAKWAPPTVQTSGSWQFGAPSQIREGDELYFQNDPNYAKNGRPAGPWRGENVIAVGGDSYCGWTSGLVPDAYGVAVPDSYNGWCDTLKEEAETNGISNPNRIGYNPSGGHPVKFFDVPSVAMAVFNLRMPLLTK